MLKSIDKVIADQTDRRHGKRLDPNGRISYPYKVKDVFDQNTQDFISNYFRLGPKKTWLLRKEAN